MDVSDNWTDIIQKMVKKTYSPRVFAGVGGFAGLFRLDYDEKLFKNNYKKPVLVACTDGVGTKILVAMQANKLDTVGIDLVAMNVNDMIVTGAEPLFFLDYMAVGKLAPKKAVELLKGITEGCRQSDCALIGGETAEMPDLYDEKEFDLAGFAVGVVEYKKILDGTQIEPGDTILGLASSGIHSNGYSLVRKIIFDKCKHKINDELPGFNCTVAEELLRPTKIYVKPIMNVLKQYAASPASELPGGDPYRRMARTENLPVPRKEGTGQALRDVPRIQYGYRNDRGGSFRLRRCGLAAAFRSGRNRV
jgi:phosphoribosylformylglycinamidine cyclo-ligase